MSTLSTIRGAVVGAIAMLVVAACGSDSDRGDEPAATPVASVPASPDSVVPVTDPPSEAATPAVTDPPGSAPPEPSDPPQPDVAMDEFREAVAANCTSAVESLAGAPEHDGTIENIEAQLAVLRTVDASFEEVPTPSDLVAQRDELIGSASDAAGAALQRAEAAAAVGDVDTAADAIDAYFGHVSSIAGRWAMLGAECYGADPTRIENADLTVPLDLGAEQLNAGFGSIWISQLHGETVVRVDPESGEIIATIDVGARPLKLQPADGRMWVRTRDEFVGIDAETNEVDALIAKADVGASANRNWAIDGTMWICDDHLLHRYDPTTLEQVAVIELDISCNFVYATDDLVVVWTYDEDPSESGTSATTMIDPSSNTVLATVELPVDVLFPAVFDDAVYFAGNLNRTSVLVDRSTWTVSKTAELPRVTGGGGVATDGASVYVPTHDSETADVFVVDPTTLEVIDTIEPVNVNGVLSDDGALWVTHQRYNLLQRFDTDD